MIAFILSTEEPEANARRPESASYSTQPKAIIHTHPNGRPNPSPDDIAMAQKLGIAVYVVTRSGVNRTDGWRTTHVARGDWNPHR